MAQENMMQMRSVPERCSSAPALSEVLDKSEWRDTGPAFLLMEPTQCALQGGHSALFPSFSLVVFEMPFARQHIRPTLSCWAEPQPTAALVHTYCACRDCTPGR